MQTKVFGCALDGLTATTVTIELNLDKGSHRVISGLPDDAIKESMARIEAAIVSLGYRMPDARITFNLAPAGLPKRGTMLDLPMALAILAASGQLLAKEKLKTQLFCGELNLSGELQPVRGALSVALHAWREKFEGVMVPYANIEEAALVTKLPVYGVHTLEEAIAFIRGDKKIEPVQFDTRKLFYDSQFKYDIDFADVKGQAYAKRGLEVAACGSFGVLMCGSPGSSKSMTAARLPTILPPLSLQEALEITEIMSVYGDGVSSQNGLVSRRPFVSCHYSTSIPGLIGGSSQPIRPGLVTKAHNGVLFLDEFAEFPRATIESLRIPIEAGNVKITRAMNTVSFPCSFMLIAATNACPCGYFNHPERSCTCSPKAIQKYLNKLSGPIMDRLPIHLELQPVEARDLISDAEEESSAIIRERVLRTREIQEQRFKQFPYVHCNGQMNTAMVKKFCKLESTAEELLMSAMRQLKLSGRAFDSILKVGLTIADMDPEKKKETISFKHLSEAIGYRSLDKDKWMAAAGSKDRKKLVDKTVFKIA